MNRCADASLVSWDERVYQGGKLVGYLRSLAIAHSSMPTRSVSGAPNWPELREMKNALVSVTIVNQPITEKSTRRLRVLVAAQIVVIAAALCGCMNLPRSAFASVRQAEYFASHDELSPQIRTAIENGHVVVGMDREQVIVVLGQPTRRAWFKHDDQAEAWLYLGHKLHQDTLHSPRAGLVRIIFLEGRVALIEPLL
jgi:hypothetical protein